MCRLDEHLHPPKFSIPSAGIAYPYTVFLTYCSSTILSPPLSCSSLQEFIREQIAAKERLKREEKLLREKEEREEEERVARERRRLQREHEEELLRAKRKEVCGRDRFNVCLIACEKLLVAYTSSIIVVSVVVLIFHFLLPISLCKEEKRQCHMKLAQKIAMAEDSARAAKQATRANLTRRTTAVTSECSAPLCLSTEFRSPSALRADSPPHRGNNQVHVGTRRRSQRNAASVRCHRPSRIPVLKNSNLIEKLKLKERGSTTTRTSFPPLPQASRSSPVPGRGVRRVRAGRNVSEATPLPPVRNPSPPVPALARKLAAEAAATGQFVSPPQERGQVSS